MKMKLLFFLFLSVIGIVAFIILGALPDNGSTSVKLIYMNMFYPLLGLLVMFSINVILSLFYRSNGPERSTLIKSVVAYLIFSYFLVFIRIVGCLEPPESTLIHSDVMVWEFPFATILWIFSAFSIYWSFFLAQILFKTKKPDSETNHEQTV